MPAAPRPIGSLAARDPMPTAPHSMLTSAAARRACILGLLVLLSPTVLAGALPRELEVRQVKAAMVVNMLRFVTWPAPALSAQPIGIVVIGDPPLADALREIAAATKVNGRALTVKQAASVAELGDAPVAVVVVAPSYRPQIASMARALEQRGSLTIGDGAGLGEAGLMISLYTDGDRVRFEANTGAAARAGITLSAHLLRLARIVG